MSRRYLSAFAIAAALFVLVAVATGSASAATIGQPANLAFQAIYGAPNFNGAEPVGGGLARSFGFGENMLFEASTEMKIGKSIEVTYEEKTGKAEETYLGGTLQSNKTGENHPLAIAFQFADFQDSSLGGSATPHYADTYDRPWIATICAPKEEKCRVDPRFEVLSLSKGNVKIEDVSLEFGGVVVQGTLWGQWINGEKGVPPCIKLESPPALAAADQTLFDTQGGTVGNPVTGITGEFCLISANNDWYIIGGTTNEPAITIEK
jgi:hypothetical protein